MARSSRPLVAASGGSRGRRGAARRERGRLHVPHRGQQLVPQHRRAALLVLLIIGFFVWMQRLAAGQMGNVMSIGRSRAKAYTTDKPSTTFADIAGYEGVKQGDH